MILLLDVGNTRIKWAELHRAISPVRQATQVLAHPQVDQLPHRVTTPPRALYASNVAGAPVRAALEAIAWNAWRQPVHWLDGRHGQHWLHNAYREPQHLGPDRWLGLLGLLWHIQQGEPPPHGTACLLASFGTATTVDTLVWEDASPSQPGVLARFVGGLILPGPTLMARSLAHDTAALPLAQGALADFPQDTHSAITSGIAAAQAGALARQWALAQQNYPAHAPRVWVTGGAWPLVAEEIRRQWRQGLAVLDNPVLDGLGWLATVQPGGARNNA